jgi:uncharacterized repeat protein (TIGR03803 family)
VIGAGNTLIGATVYGGTFGGGTVFKLTTDGSGFTVLKHLNPNTEGRGSYGVTIGSDGMIYGTTSQYASCLFKLAQDGTGFTILHGLSNPAAPPTEGPGGFLYGTTFYGALYKIDRNGSGFSILGVGPGSIEASLLLGADGKLYGTTTTGGP